MGHVARTAEDKNVLSTKEYLDLRNMKEPEDGRN
jgi:hypothetical protein